jgi:hypothetical protein
MRPTTVYVTSAAEFDKHKERLKQIPCPKCRAVGCLIRHGYLAGHGDKANDEVRRGWRVFCSDRNLRAGCGKTHSVLLAKFIFRHMVSAPWLWQLLQHIRRGLSVKAGWEQIASPFSLETAYRLRQAFTRSQSFIRSMLLRAGAPPKLEVAEPQWQLIEHLQAAFPGSACPVADFQVRFQAAFFSARTPHVNRSG